MASTIQPAKIVPADATPDQEIRAQFTAAAADIEAGIHDAEIDLTEAGAALSLTDMVSHIEMAGDDDGAFTLADGTNGQMKVIVLASRASTGNAVITPANLANGTTITLDAAGESAILVFAYAAWHVIGGTNTVA